MVSCNVFKSKMQTVSYRLQKSFIPKSVEKANFTFISDGVGATTAKKSTKNYARVNLMGENNYKSLVELAEERGIRAPSRICFNAWKIISFARRHSVIKNTPLKNSKWAIAAQEKTLKMYGKTGTSAGTAYGKWTEANNGVPKKNCRKTKQNT